MAININHPRALLPGAQARIDASALPMGPQRSDLPGMDRLFAGVHNLHQNDGFRNAFSRVQPSAVQVKAYMGKGLNKLATFSPENGIPVAKLKVKRRDADEHISARQAEKNFNKVQSGYTSLRRELRQLDLPPGQNQRGFLNALRRLFGLDKAEVQLDFKAEHVPAAAPPEPDNNPAPADGLAPGAAADAAPMALPGKVQLTITSGKDQRLLGKAGEPVSFTAQDAAQYQSKVGKQKAAWLVAGGTGLAAAAVLAATVPVLGWIGGGVIAAGILMKAAFGKSPWWGKTAEGQMQKSARQEARHAADAIAQMVKRQVLCDTTEHNVGAPEGGYQKQDILSDKNMLTDFVRLARQDDPKALQRRVRAFVMSANSPLPEATRKMAGQGNVERFVKLLLWPGNWFQGDPKGHARKTVDLMTQEISRGIMQGVQEGVLQSAILDLSNDLSNEARKVLYDVPLPRLAQFQRAVAGLYPSANNSGHPIYKAEDILKDLKTFQSASTRGLLEQLNQRADVIGPENLKSYGDLLRKLDGDVQTHMASMEQIQGLLGQPAGPADPPPNTVANLETCLTSVAGGQLDASELDQVQSQIQTQIQVLRDRVANAGDPGTDKLVQSHAQQFLQLLDGLSEAADLSLQAARELAQIRADFSQANPAPTMEQVRTHLKNLEKLSQSYIDPQKGNPAENQELTAAQILGQKEADRLKNLCKELIKAHDAAQEVRGIMDTGLAKANQGDLAGALDYHAILEPIDDQIAQQKNSLGEWDQAGFAKPSDLKAYGQGDIDTFRSQACAGAIGLAAEEVQDLQTVLLTLSKGDKSEVIGLLRAETQQHAPGVRQALATLQDLLPKAGDTPEQAESKALRSFAALNEQRVFGHAIEHRQQLVQSLHPGSLPVLNAYQQVHTIHGDLRELFNSPLSEKLFAWGEKHNLVDPGSRANHGFDARLTLSLLHRFSQDAKAGSILDTQGLGRLVEAWPQNGKIEEWSLNPAVLKSLDAQTLSQAEGLVKTVATGFEKRLQLKALKAQALAKLHANQIVAGGQGSSDPKVQAALAQASEAKDPAQMAQLQEVAQDLRLMQQDQDDTQRRQRLDSLNITKLSAFIKDKLGYKGKPEALAQRIAENPELSAEFMLLIDTGVRLAGAEPPPLLTPFFTPEQLLAGANDLATYAPNKYLESLRPELKPMVEQRNAMIEKIRNTKPEARARLLAKDVKVRAYIESFLNEEHAYRLLASNSKLEKSPKELRIILDDTGDPVERSQALVEMTRESTLTPANLEKIQRALNKGLEKQEQALAQLHQGAKEQYGPSMSTYMQDQMALLAAQKLAAQRLPEAYTKPETGDLAQMGQLLRQVDGLKGKTQEQIQRAYLKGQNQASQEALKYFDIRRFDAKRPGFLGRLIFSIMRRGQPLSRLLRSAGEEKNALARAIGDLITARVSQKISQEQLAVFEERIRALQTAKDELVSDPAKVRNALFMVAEEHLAAKQGQAPRITEADLPIIVGQWKSLLAGATQDCFPEIEKFAQSLLGQGAEDLEAQLNSEDKAQLALDLGDLMRQQDALVAQHQDIRGQLQAIDLADNKPPPGVLRLYRAGLDRSDQEGVEALEAALAKASNGAKSDLLTPWSQAGDLLAKDPASALHLAGRELRRLEITLANPGSLSPQQREQVRRLKDSLEDAFLARMGPGAPARLERSVDHEGAVAIAKRADELSKKMIGFDDPKKLQAWIRSGKDGVSQFLNDLQSFDLELREQLEQHPIEQLRGQRSPRSLRALAELASARIVIGQIYAKLSEAPGELSQDLDLIGTDAVDKLLMRQKADSHLYGGLFMRQELLDKNNAWSPDSNLTMITGIPKSDSRQMQRKACEALCLKIPKDKPLQAALAESLDDAAERRLDMAMMESQLDDSLDGSMDGATGNRLMFAFVGQ